MTYATSTGVRDAHVLVPFGAAGPADARLSFDNGLERLDLRADGELDTLLEARFADPLPVVWAAEHNIHVEYPLGSRLLRRMRPSTVKLNSAAAWSLDIHGGAAYLDADLAGLRVQAVSFHSGVAHSRLALGRPTGRCTIRLSSLKDLRVERPADVPVRVEIAKGATNIALDDRRFGAVGNGLTDNTPGYDAMEDRYLLVVSSGVDGLTVTQRR
jgi:hypothetical protein